MDFEVKFLLCHKPYNLSSLEGDMRVYIAGRIRGDLEKQMLEKIDKLCVSLGFETFLPHRDVGIARGMEDVKMIFRGDILEGFKKIDLVVALLDGFHVGAGTAWELGYAYAKKIPALGLKTDEPLSESLDSLSAILLGSMEIVHSFKELEKRLQKFKGKD